MKTITQIRRKILEENDRIAASIRQWLHEQGTFAVNLVSSPGAGKTELLTRTLVPLSRIYRVAVVG